MTEQAQAAATDPAQVWAQWYDATVGPWSRALGADGGVSGVGTAEFTRQLAEASAQTWRRWAELLALLVRLAPRSVDVAEQMRRQLLEGGLPTDPLDVAGRWYDVTSGPLSDALRELLGDEAYLELSRRNLENYATAEAVFRRAAEDFFGRLQLSTRSDSARVAALVVGLDAKVDRLEEAVEDYLDGAGGRAGGRAAPTADAELVERLRRVEDKLDRLLAGSGRPGGLGWPDGEAARAAAKGGVE